MNEDERCFYYRGFLLMCDPLRLDSGGFEARAAICQRGAEGPAVFATSPDDVVVISEEAAVEYARTWAIQWVDRHLA